MLLDFDQAELALALQHVLQLRQPHFRPPLDAKTAPNRLDERRLFSRRECAHRGGHERLQQELFRLRTLAGVLSEHFGQQQVELIGPLRSVAQLRGGLGLDGPEDVQNRLDVGKRRHPFRELDERDAQRPHIREVCGTRPCDHFGRHPQRRPDHLFSVSDAVDPAAKAERDSEIGDFDFACGSEQDVAGLEVAVDDLSLVQVQEGLERVEADVLDLRLVERAECVEKVSE
mmetsp:Transcript_27838/g.49152  ORF Transcript_27838/g.49152 Transcript_27838/m.49152 type:complete len:230 (-) Transcript_27838:955-1644(-)